jgi:hypothetical protein
VEVAITPPGTPAHMGLNPQQQLNQSMMLNRSMMLGANLASGGGGTNLVHRNVKQNIMQQFPPGVTVNAVNSQQLGNRLTIAGADMNTPVNKTNLNSTQAIGGGQQQQQMPPSAAAAAPGSASLNTTARTLLPRPIINPNRTYLDKILDFIIGEGPNNRLENANNSSFFFEIVIKYFCVCVVFNLIISRH